LAGSRDCGKYDECQNGIHHKSLGNGFIFPASILISKMIRANIFYRNEISSLGVWANIFQIFFFPIFFISAKANIQFPPIFMGILAGAHFVFYYWLFNSKGYLFISFSMVLADYFLGYYFFFEPYTMIGLANSIMLLITCGILLLENKQALQFNRQSALT
jgi:hypothetical protein